MNKRVVILTGTNRGLGRRTAEILVEKYTQDFTYIFTQRSGDDSELKESLLKINPQADFKIKQLDISISESRQQFIQWFSQNYPKLDVLFNNAAIHIKEDWNDKRPSKQTAEQTFNVNFISTVEFTEEMFALLSDDGKIIEMSSFVGQLSFQSEIARDFLSDETLTKERLYKLANEFIEKTASDEIDLIFNMFVYITTKAFLNAYIRFVATKYIKPNQSIFAVNPGWVQTDMGGKNADLTVDQACPDLAQVVAEYPFGRHPLNGKLIFKHKDIGY